MKIRKFWYLSEKELIENLKKNSKDRELIEEAAARWIILFNLGKLVQTSNQCYEACKLLGSLGFTWDNLNEEWKK